MQATCSRLADWPARVSVDLNQLNVLLAAMHSHKIKWLGCSSRAEHIQLFGQMEQHEDELSRIEEILRRPDFVLEQRCLATVIEYVKAGGSPQNVIDMLADGYIGVWRYELLE